MSKEKYTGRSYEELKNVRVSEMTGAEFEVFNKKTKADKPGSFGLFFAGAIEGGARAVRERKERIMALGEERYEKNAREEELESQIDMLRDELKSQNKI